MYAVGEIDKSETHKSVVLIFGKILIRIPKFQIFVILTNFVKILTSNFHKNEQITDTGYPHENEVGT